MKVITEAYLMKVTRHDIAEKLLSWS